LLVLVLVLAPAQATSTRTSNQQPATSNQLFFHGLAA